MAALDHAFETVTSRSSVARAAPLSSACARELGAVGEVARRAGDDQRRGGVENGDVAIGVALAVEHRAQRRGIMRGIAALEVGGLGARAARRPPASTAKARISPSSSSTTAVVAVVVISSRPSPPWTTQTRSEPRLRSTSAIGFSQAEENTPISWRLTPAGIGERPEQVEDRAGAEFDAHRADVAHRRVMGRRHHEADAGLAHAALDAFGRQADLDAERASASAAPDFEEAARLPCLATGTPQAATISEASVETL